MHEAIQYFDHLHAPFHGVCTESDSSPVPQKAKIYATGLDGPRGLKFRPDGKLYVSNFGAVPGAGAGQILQIEVN
jgi:glucose/arabinose dehydrogenase